MKSRIPGFYRLEPDDRIRALIEAGAVSAEQARAWRDEPLALRCADQMVENVIATFELPNAVAVNLRIDGRDRVVPMVVEEPSVVAAVSNMARLCRDRDGIVTDTDHSVMIGQIHLPNVTDADAVAARIEASFDQLRAVADTVHPRLNERGGGFRGLRVRKLRFDAPGHTAEDMIVVEFLIDCCDAMGANIVNTMAEALAPHIEEISGFTVGLRILSNLASERLARATVRVPFTTLERDCASGREVAEGITAAWRFAWADPWRAATHNKGVMNGIDAVVIATGNDWRAIEAGAHAWCCRDGQYRPMTAWHIDGDALVGTIELPMQVGTVGGPIRVHPKTRANLALLGDPTARELAGICVAVGLVQNLSALRALASEGIQEGHMRMHARTVAVLAGAQPSEVSSIVATLCADQDFSLERAKAAIAARRSP